MTAGARAQADTARGFAMPAEAAPSPPTTPTRRSCRHPTTTRTWCVSARPALPALLLVSSLAPAGAAQLLDLQAAEPPAADRHTCAAHPTPLALTNPQEEEGQAAAGPNAASSDSGGSPPPDESQQQLSDSEDDDGCAFCA